MQRGEPGQWRKHDMPLNPQRQFAARSVIRGGWKTRLPVHPALERDWLFMKGCFVAREYHSKAILAVVFSGLLRKVNNLNDAGLAFVRFAVFIASPTVAAAPYFLGKSSGLLN